MGNKPSQSGSKKKAQKPTATNTSMSIDVGKEENTFTATKVTLNLEGIVINEDKQKNTKSIQLYKNGKLSSEIITISTEFINFEQKTIIQKTKYHQNVLYNWSRKALNDNFAAFLVDKNVILLILKYCKLELTIRLTKPLSKVGAKQNMHHLHIRQIEIYSKLHQFCSLKFKNASKCVIDGHGGRSPLICIDGDRSEGSFNHSDHSNPQKINAEDLWMEFIIDENKKFIESVNDIGYVVIYNRIACAARLQGAVIQLFSDGVVVKEWTVNQVRKMYKFHTGYI
eukprot:145927_1